MTGVIGCSKRIKLRPILVLLAVACGLLPLAFFSDTTFSPNVRGRYASSADETGSLTDHTLFPTGTAPGAGEFRYSIYAMSNATCAVPGPAGVTVGAKWTDITGTQKTVASIPLDVNGSTTLTGTVPLGDVTSWGTGFLTIFSNSSQNIIFNTTFTACTTGTAKYRVYVTVEQVQ